MDNESIMCLTDTIYVYVQIDAYVNKRVPKTFSNITGT